MHFAHRGQSSLTELVQVKDKRVLVATGQPKMLERLQESNILLDDIQKGLNTYLEKKRLYFPRFRAFSQALAAQQSASALAIFQRS